MSRVQLVCQFGTPVRGVSPYADGLLSALQALAGKRGVEIQPVDFISPFPQLLHPARSAHVEMGELAWYNPASWLRVARAPGDILHLQHWAPPLASYLSPLLALARRAGKRNVITVHNPLPHESAGVFDTLEQRMYQHADALIVHGEQGERDLRKRLGHEAPTIHVIPHGMNVADAPVQATPEDFLLAGLDPSHRHILLFGNLRPYKGLDVLLDAWTSIRQQLPNTRLVVAGQSWNTKHRPLARLAAYLLGTGSKLPQTSTPLMQDDLPSGVVLREGFLEDAVVDALIRCCNLAVFPYRHFSGQSGAACRTAAMGRPILVSRVGALPELAIDSTWTVPPADSEALATTLFHALGHAESFEENAGARQLDRLQAFRWPAVANRHIALYESLLT